MWNGFKFLTHVESKRSLFEVVVKPLAHFYTQFNPANGAYTCTQWSCSICDVINLNVKKMLPDILDKQIVKLGYTVDVSAQQSVLDIKANLM